MAVMVPLTSLNHVACSEKGSLSVLDIFKMKNQHLSTEKNKFLELSEVLAERLARAIFL